MFRCMMIGHRSLAVLLVRALPLLAMITTAVPATSASAQDLGHSGNEDGTVELNVSGTLRQDVLSDIGAQFRSAGIEVEFVRESGMREMGTGTDLSTPSVPVTAVEMIPMGTGEYMLSDFSEFIEVDATADFDIWDKMIWTNRQIFNRKAFDELVVLYGYPLQAVCRDRVDEAAAALAAHGGFLMWSASDGFALAYEASEYGEYADGMSEAWRSVFRALNGGPDDSRTNVSPKIWGTMVNVALSAPSPSPIAPVCRAEWWETGTWNVHHAAAGGIPEWWTPIPWGSAEAMLASHLHDLGPAAATYFMTADPVPGLEPTTEIWARCNVREPETLGSACHATLAMSQYSDHRAIPAQWSDQTYQ